MQGYLRALGEARTAQVKRDARIGEAEALRDSGRKVFLSSFLYLMFPFSISCFLSLILSIFLF